MGASETLSLIQQSLAEQEILPVMGQERWEAVDEYVSGLLAPHDRTLEEALEAGKAAGLPAIQVSPPQGKLLYLLAKSVGARSVLEFGTLGAYSTIWLGRALPRDGRLITLEADPRYASVARESIAHAELGEVVDLRVGKALDLLPVLDSESAGPFDFTFIDADKENSPAYFSWALDRSRPGALILVDNVVRGGSLADSESDDPKVQAQRHLHEMLAAEERVVATTVQTVGSKGYDGLSLALVR
jgi:predicted O-methyltransferase YrrM